MTEVNLVTLAFSCAVIALLGTAVVLVLQIRERRALDRTAKVIAEMDEAIKDQLEKQVAHSAGQTA